MEAVLKRRICSRKHIGYAIADVQVKPAENAVSLGHFVPLILSKMGGIPKLVSLTAMTDLRYRTYLWSTSYTRECLPSVR